MSDVRCISAHSVDIDLLPETPMIIDVGCRDFAFDVELLVLRPFGRVVGLDPDPTIVAPDDSRITFLTKALTHWEDKSLWWRAGGEGSYIATRDIPGIPSIPASQDPGMNWPYVAGETIEVPNVTLKELTQKYGHFDVIKLDCEGSEFGLLENWPGPIATQISVEFHDWTNRGRWTDDYFQRLFSGPLKDYKPVVFGLTPIGTGKHLGHWDSLLVLR